MNSATPFVRHLQIFPWKSFNPVACQQVKLLPSGAIENDRRWALFDQNGNCINGKRTPLIHRIGVQFDQPLKNVTISLPITAEAAQVQMLEFRWPKDQRLIEERFSIYFGQPVHFAENTVSGFPDDQNAPGPTVIGSATLFALTGLFPEISYEQMRLRMRTNIELETTAVCWEDCLFAEPERMQKFQIGNVTFWGVNPCQRCVVPSRHPETGTTTSAFQKRFSEWRKQNLRTTNGVGHFNHYYRLAVNTRIAEQRSDLLIQLQDFVQISS